VSFNNITDINALADMNGLVELGLTDVNLSTITPLADVNQIQILWLGYNFIEDINVLTNFQNLTTLALRCNPMNFESWTDYLRQIIDNNPSATITTSALLNDYQIDMDDMIIFVDRWLRQNCSWANSDCGGADFDESGIVDFWDFSVFADWWIG
jgi:Leucine-rich repeat (LRR) protein